MYKFSLVLSIDLFEPYTKIIIEGCVFHNTGGSVNHMLKAPQQRTRHYNKTLITK